MKKKNEEEKSTRAYMHIKICRKSEIWYTGRSRSEKTNGICAGVAETASRCDSKGTFVFRSLILHDASREKS